MNKKSKSQCKKINLLQYNNWINVKNLRHFGVLFYIKYSHFYAPEQT